MIQQQRITSIPAILSVRHRAPAAAAIIPWWLSGGAPTPVAVYQPKGAASLAASYVNLVTPGMYDAAPGTAPTWASATGWQFNRANMQYLMTGVVPSSNYSILVRFSNRSNENYQGLAGCGFGSNGERFFVGFENTVYGIAYGYGTGYSLRGPNITEGVLGLAGKQPYRNGSADGAEITGILNTSRQIYIGAGNGTVTSYSSVKIQAASIYSAILSSSEVLAVSTAMAAL